MLKSSMLRTDDNFSIYIRNFMFGVEDSLVSTVGILAGASKLLADAGINIRQALVDDPELDPDPKLVLIGEKAVPGELIPEILKIKGVAKVSVS